MMTVNDKHNLIELISKKSGVYKLELGCGEKKVDPDSIGIDLIDSENVDIVGDAYEVLNKLPVGSIKSISSTHFVEHLEDLELFLSLCSNVLVSEGTLNITVPHFSSPYFYSDPTHKLFFGLYTFCYFSSCSFLSRKVPTYEHKINFNLKHISLGFKSPRPFYGRYIVKRGIGFLINSTYYLMEFWEENLSGIFPCYEISYILTKKN